MVRRCTRELGIVLEDLPLAETWYYSIPDYNALRRSNGVVLERLFQGIG